MLSSLEQIAGSALVSYLPKIMRIRALNFIIDPVFETVDWYIRVSGPFIVFFRVV